MVTKNEMIVGIQNIQKQRGQGYFIMPGCTTSRKITGNNDFWQYTYQIHYLKPNGEPDVDYCYTMTDFVKSLHQYPTEKIIAVQLIVEHVATKCGSFKAEHGPDVHCHEETLSVIPGPQYEKYSDML